MNQFLADPDHETGMIRAAQHHREHMASKIEEDQADATTKMVRSGSPHLISMTKTTGSHRRAVQQYEADLQLFVQLQQVGGSDQNSAV